MKRKLRTPLSITAAHCVGDMVRTFRGEELRVTKVIGSFGYFLADEIHPYGEDEIAKPGRLTGHEKRAEGRK
jgi:hypothetical protein